MNTETIDERNLKALWKFFFKHGHAHVPASDPKYEELYEWARYLRASKRHLSDKLIHELDQMAFNWRLHHHQLMAWEELYEELKAFKKKYGHCKVPSPSKEHKTLGDWVSKQRRDHKADRMLKDRFIRLNALGFLWHYDIVALQEKQWEDNYQKLKRFYETHGHTDRLVVKKTDYHLGLWIETQLNAQHRMVPSRKAKLDAINFQWKKILPTQRSWEHFFPQFKVFVEAHGHARVTRKSKLRNWVQRIRSGKVTISEKQRAELDALGFLWAGEIFDSAWKKRCEQLKAFVKKYGHSEPSRRKYRSLADWVFDIRKSRKSLSAERRAELEALGFQWQGSKLIQEQEKWECCLQKFKRIKAIHPYYLVEIYHHHPELDYWVRRQKHNKQKLSVEKLKKLSAVGFPWNETYEIHLWLSRYDRLKAFKVIHGHCFVTRQYEQDTRFVTWVNSQRTQYRRMAHWKKEKLEALSFEPVNAFTEYRWQQRYEELCSIKKEHGDAYPIHSQSPLGSWIYQQRKNWHKLPEKKKKLLKQVGVEVK